MLFRSGSNWETYLPQIRYAYDVQNNGKYLTVASREQIFLVNESHQIVKEVNRYSFGSETVFPISPRSAVTTENGMIWIADNLNSMVKVSGDQTERARLNSPFDNVIFSINHSGTDLWVAPGGTKGWEIPRFQRFRNNQWDYFRKSSNPELDGFFNVLLVTEDPFNTDHFFVATWGGGVLEYRNNQFVTRFTNKNSPLQTALPTQPDEQIGRASCRGTV